MSPRAFFLVRRSPVWPGRFHTGSSEAVLVRDADVRDQAKRDSAASLPPRQPLARNVKLLGAASLLNDIASEMIFPLMPQFLLTLAGGSKEQLGLIEGAADALASLLKLASGGWSDRLRHRKWLVVVGYLLAALTRPLAALATRPWNLLAIRLADRTGKGIRTSPRDAMIAESTAPDNRGRAFGFHRAMDHLGAALGPALAAAFLWFRPDELRLLFALTLVP